MKVATLIQLEEAVLLLAAYLLTLILGYSWWIFPALLFIPDISVLGYLANAKAGAILYNLFHNRATALATGFTGLLSGSDPLLLSGIILFGHIGMDRMLGFGLKYKKGFRYNHLGILNSNKRHDETHGC